MSIQVKPLVDSWELKESTAASTGVKKFVNEEVYPAGGLAATVNLPELGDSWDDLYKNLVVIEIVHKYLTKNDACGKIYTVNYSTISDESDEASDFSDLTTNISLSGNYRTISAVDGDWKWEDAGEDESGLPADARLPIREFTEIVELQRYVYASSFIAYNNQIALAVGKVNSSVFLGVPVGYALFTGALANELPRVPLETRKWLVRLQFNVRQISWQKLYDAQTNTFRSPKNGDNFLYEETDFNPLLTVARQII